MFADEEAVLAIVALETSVLDPREALEVIRQARLSETSPLDALGGLVSVAALRDAVATELGIEIVDLFAPGAAQPSASLMDRASSQWLERFVAVPLAVPDGSIIVASANPIDPALDDYLQVTYPEGYRTVMAATAQIRQVLSAQASATATAAFDDIAALQGAPGPGQSPVLAWIDASLASAASQGASDLHFELAADGSMLCRFRLDGALIPQPMPLQGRELEVIAALLSRAQMDSANLREPQDGAFSFTVDGRRIDLRASMIPLATGPKLVLRMLDPDNLRSLDELGFGTESLALMRRAATISQGLVVVAGPTGSGKTTTLYAILREVVDESKNVMTIENPIEYRLPLVSQIPVRPDLGERSITFARALRTILRLDPDVILVGEIRDAETARVAADASLTGHLVLTTVHAPSASGVFTRLVEMGLPAYLVAESVSLSISQRLVRRLHSCATRQDPDAPTAVALTEAGLPVPDQVSVPQGCPACNQRGYRGRIAVAEVVAPDEATRAALVLGRGVDAVDAAARASERYVPAHLDLSRLLAAGETSPAEVLRVVAGATL